MYAAERPDPIPYENSTRNHKNTFPHECIKMTGSKGHKESSNSTLHGVIRDLYSSAKTVKRVTVQSVLVNCTDDTVKSRQV